MKKLSDNNLVCTLAMRRNSSTPSLMWQIPKRRLYISNKPWIFIGRTDPEAEAPILWPLDAKSWLIRKDPDARKDWGWEKGVAEHEMVWLQHGLNGHEFQQTPGDSEGQGSLVCCSLWGRRVRHDLVTEQQHQTYAGCPSLTSLPQANSLIQFYLS